MSDARASIIDAAFRLFLEKGYDGTSLNRILDEVPFSKGALYHHFKNKEALLDAVIERFFSTSLVDPVRPRPATPLALAHRLVDDYVDAVESISAIASPLAYYSFLIQVAPRVQPALNAARVHIDDELSTALGALLPADPDAARVIAADLTALVEGAGLLDVLLQRVPDREHLHERVDGLVRAHLAARGVALPVME
ncbi:MAG: TetR/AcrR family transcriptional regulator [Microcella sp.]|uniref:TetR/AcrR family transcriptional regulator n=1 Tax=Microcella sp. TaxID=1913979 RepID=UPI0024CDE700|nr:TetR/AcrR family transcriptional regulator [Microcella sp.]UYN82944.1 MAG: TetR/AcrR family transcriptional regulator [Microcella sp.]